VRFPKNRQGRCSGARCRRVHKATLRLCSLPLLLGYNMNETAAAVGVKANKLADAGQEEGTAYSAPLIA
jgi:hypothetical protein